MVIFSSKAFDLDGSVAVQEEGGGLEQRGSIRRVSRTATLDGDVAIDDAGYSEGDRTFNVSVVDISHAALNTLHRIHSLYSVHRCSTEEGLFEGVIEEITLSQRNASISFLVSRKLSQ